MSEDKYIEDMSREELIEYIEAISKHVIILMSDFADLKKSTNHNFHTLSHVLFEHGINVGGCHGQHDENMGMMN